MSGENPIDGRRPGYVLPAAGRVAAAGTRNDVANMLPDQLVDYLNSTFKNQQAPAPLARSAAPSASQPLSIPAISIPQKVDARQLLIRNLGVIQNAVPPKSPEGNYTLTFLGQAVTVSASQYQQLRSDTIAKAKDDLEYIVRKARSAQGLYDEGQKIDHQNLFRTSVSSVVKGTAYVTTWGDYKDPKKELASLVSTVYQVAAAAEKALSEGRLTDAAALFADADSAATRASNLAYNYQEGKTSGGETLATGLEGVRDLSFFALGVLAIYATGGAAAAGGVDLSITEASAAKIITAATPTLAALAEAGVKTASGDKVDWTKDVAWETVINLLTIYLQGQAGKAILKKLGNDPIVQKASATAAKNVIAAVLSSAGGRGFADSLRMAYQRITGESVDPGQFLNQLLAHITDPRAILGDAVLGGLAARGQVRGARRYNELSNQANRAYPPLGTGSLSDPLGMKPQPGAAVPGTQVPGVTTAESYVVRVGVANKPGLYYGRMFPTLQEAESYAHQVAQQGERPIRSQNALPFEWPPNAGQRVPGNPVVRVNIYKAPPGLSYEKSAIAPQPESRPSIFRAPTYAGGGPQVLINANAVPQLSLVKSIPVGPETTVRIPSVFGHSPGPQPAPVQNDEASKSRQAWLRQVQQTSQFINQQTVSRQTPHNSQVLAQQATNRQIQQNMQVTTLQGVNRQIQLNAINAAQRSADLRPTAMAARSNAAATSERNNRLNQQLISQQVSRTTANQVSQLQLTNSVLTRPAAYTRPPQAYRPPAAPAPNPASFWKTGEIIGGMQGWANVPVHQPPTRTPPPQAYRPPNTAYQSPPPADFPNLSFRVAPSGIPMSVPQNTFSDVTSKLPPVRFR